MILIPILIYILIILLLFIYKPSILFDKNKNSLISLDIIYPFIAILCYYGYILLLLLIKD
jgi:hypothetical protein